MRLIEEISEEEAQAMAEQGPRPENLPAGMSLSEEAEFDRLKEKYSHHQRQRDMGPGPTVRDVLCFFPLLHQAAPRVFVGRYPVARLRSLLVWVVRNFA